jgi:hypothetical protein
MAIADLLRLLDGGHAFDPVALPGHRSALYVPFDDLAVGEHETRIRREVRNVQRIALAGTIGSGKSSMIEYALSGCDDVAPIWIDATHESTEVLVEPREFARQLIRAVVAWARAARTMSEDERREALLESSRTLPVRTRREKESFSLRLALTWLGSGWSREVEQTLADPEIERSAEDFVESLDRLIELVHGRLERVPVVVIDDSDRWLRFEREDRERLIKAFFTRTCRMLAERNWALVVRCTRSTRRLAASARRPQMAFSTCTWTCRL